MMRKKLPLLSLVLLLSLGAFAQTIVSTTPENRKVILEEFTGIHCGFCPQGHAIAQQLKDDNPDNVFLVNIHSGGYAVPAAGEPDFRTPWGEAIDNQSGLAGYPAGTINRENFPGQEQGNAGSTALGRGQWVSAAGTVMGQASYVNVGIEAAIDVQTNIMTIDVEAFYTGNSPEATNKLTIAILQNNTLGPQASGGLGNNYNHQHRLIDLVTGQWGLDVAPTTNGSLYANQLSYTIPADNNGVPIDFAELEVVAFISETTQFIASGNGATPTYSGIANANDISVLSVDEIQATCVAEVGPIVNIRNLGQNDLTSLDITYSVNGEAPSTYNWTGTLTSFQREAVQLPAVAFNELAANTVEVSIPSDDVDSNNESSTGFDGVVEGAGDVVLSITTDQYADETSWEFLDSSGAVIASGDLTAANNNSTVDIDVQLGEVDCYRFNLNDSYGDGIFNGGGASLTDINGVLLLEVDGLFGDINGGNVRSTGVLGLDDVTLTEVTVYPNPTSNMINITNVENATLEVYNILGQVMTTKESANATETINVSQYAAGTYFVKIDNGTNSSTKKFIVTK